MRSRNIGFDNDCDWDDAAKTIKKSQQYSLEQTMGTIEKSQNPFWEKEEIKKN